MAQIIRITSEALQATIRRLLPSQQGFGEDLQATNVITPVIDVTPTAEGSQLPVDLARSLDISAAAVEVGNSTFTTSVTPGFYRVFGVSIIANTNNQVNIIAIDTGLSTVDIFKHRNGLFTADSYSQIPFDFTVFLDTNHQIKFDGGSTSTQYITAQYRQIADRYGNITNPNGFTFE